ncbi:hypothetical protein ZIOFF_057013 [Zingiber officinale]|uniref:Uncharacterized protein n=1 Tax=Zingiber officinale TaxID=94328 RepID=A0A8J5KQQ8_ZINOF|nr:hypothetical protein ZIOFF_057013 [Zingiber officinale]
MLVPHELQHLLLQVLPSSSMMAQGRLLCIQNHLAMVCDSLWSINSMIVIPEMRMLYNNMSERWTYFGKVLDVPPEFADWERYVAAAVIDAEDDFGTYDLPPHSEWNELKNILLRVGGPGSGVLIIYKTSTESAQQQSHRKQDKLENDTWLIPFARQHSLDLPVQTFGAKVFGSLIHINLAVFDRSFVAQEIFMVRNFPLVIVRLLQYHHLLDADIDDADSDYDVILHMLTS